MGNKTKNIIVYLTLTGYLIMNGLLIYNLPGAFFKLITWIGCEEIV